MAFYKKRWTPSKSAKRTLIVNNKNLGTIKGWSFQSDTKRWVFSLEGADLAAVAISQAEIAHMVETGTLVGIVLKKIEVPDGMDAEHFGSTLVKAV